MFGTVKQFFEDISRIANAAGRIANTFQDVGDLLADLAADVKRLADCTCSSPPPTHGPPVGIALEKEPPSAPVAPGQPPAT